jgi:hypothetical protein
MSLLVIYQAPCDLGPGEQKVGNWYAKKKSSGRSIYDNICLLILLLLFIYLRSY